MVCIRNADVFLVWAGGGICDGEKIPRASLCGIDRRTRLADRGASSVARIGCDGWIGYDPLCGLFSVLRFASWRSVFLWAFGQVGGVDPHGRV